MPPFVKICGLTRLEDAALAATLGADALGFVFAASKRQVRPEQVQAIAAGLPSGVSKVGVFGPDERSIAAAVAEACGLDTLQFHGPPDVGLCTSLRGRFTVVQAIGVEADAQALQRRVSAIAPHVDRILLDTASTTLLGGTGHTFDWAALAELDCSVPLIVAGGLNPANVRELVRRYAPWGVDVASGVEASPGIKDAERMRAFFAAL